MLPNAVPYLWERHLSGATRNRTLSYGFGDRLATLALAPSDAEFRGATPRPVSNRSLNIEVLVHESPPAESNRYRQITKLAYYRCTRRAPIYPNRQLAQR